MHGTASIAECAFLYYDRVNRTFFGCLIYVRVCLRACVHAGGWACVRAGGWACVRAGGWAGGRACGRASVRVRVNVCGARACVHALVCVHD